MMGWKLTKQHDCCRNTRAPGTIGDCSRQDGHAGSLAEDGEEHELLVVSCQF